MIFLRSEADCSGCYCIWEECSVTISSLKEEEQRGGEEGDERRAIDGLGKDGEIGEEKVVVGGKRRKRRMKEKSRGD